MGKPLISYVLTAYNNEQFIEESITCAFTQTYSPLEIILSDDCSSDSTFEIMKRMAKEYSGPNKVILNRNEYNLGIARHMNKAYLELAHGEIIVAAHGDDISIPERTQMSFDYLMKNPDVTALSFSMVAIDETGKNINAHSAVVDSIHEYNFKTGGNIPAPSRCFYKKVMDVFGPLNSDCPTEDELISFRSLMLGRNLFLPECAVKYRKHRGSSSNPENFCKFPLEKILKQQNDDMKVAVQLGLIGEREREEKYCELVKQMEIRKLYRVYFANRSVINLKNLLRCKYVSLKLKLYYLKKHIEYLWSK